MVKKYGYGKLDGKEEWLGQNRRKKSVVKVKQMVEKSGLSKIDGKEVWLGQNRWLKSMV